MVATPTPTPIVDNPFGKAINDTYDLLEGFFEFMNSLLNCIPMAFWLPLLVLAIGGLSIALVKKVHKD